MRDSWIVKDEVRDALCEGKPVLAFESTVLTHGLPYPTSRDLALRVEAVARRQGCIPATIGMIDGVIHVGMTPEEIDQLAGDGRACKGSGFDIAFLVAAGRSAGVTVSGTLAIAERAGIHVFATGGIGGVHRGASETFDISHDLASIARSQVVTVCAGAKAILDLPKTVEYLETVGVCVLGYRTDTLPAFYTADSGIPLTYRVESAEEVADAFMARRTLGFGGGLLVAAPIPKEKELPPDEINQAIEDAVKLAGTKGVRGKALTPYLLGQLAKITGGRSVEANLALLENNARVGAEIATSISRKLG
jgi:pseudouridine-5'-phosphate glycosidase